MNTFSQGNEAWKQVTKDMTIYAYNPGFRAAEGTLQVLPADGSEDDWPYTRARPSPGSARILRSLVTARPPSHPREK